MWVYFNSLNNSVNLICKKVITHGMPARVGNAGSFYIFCYVEGVNSFTNATLSLKDPLGKTVSNEGILGTQKTELFILKLGENNQNVYPFQNNTNYTGFNFLFETSAILYMGGKWTANATFYTSQKNYVTQTFSFEVEQSSTNIKNTTDVSLSQYQAIISRISGTDEKINALKTPKTFTIVKDLTTNINSVRYNDGSTSVYSFIKTGNSYIFAMNGVSVLSLSAMQSYIKFMTGYNEFPLTKINSANNSSEPNYLFLISINENKIYYLEYNQYLVAKEYNDFPLAFKNVQDALVQAVQQLQTFSQNTTSTLTQIEANASANAAEIETIKNGTIFFETNEYTIPEEDK